MTDPDPSVSEAIASIRADSPLIVSYTNSVTVNEVANTTLHWGGLPVMSEDKREAADMLSIASGVLINMGTIDAVEEERILTAGSVATEEGLPVVFDPVGVGATRTRTRVAERIVDEVDLTIIKGNYGEITALTGTDADVKGVESVGEYAEIAETVIACAQQTGAIVVASGETDIIGTKEKAYELSCGDPMMGQFVGSGCLLGVTLATFAGAVDDPLEAALSGTAAFGVAGERAATDGTWDGPASYQTAFLDAIAQETGDDIHLASRLSAIAEA